MTALFNWLADRINSEPALFYALVQNLITLAVSFGLNLTPDQIGAILVVTNTLLAIVVRQKVTPVP